MNPYIFIFIYIIELFTYFTRPVYTTPDVYYTHRLSINTFSVLDGWDGMEWNGMIKWVTKVIMIIIPAINFLCLCFYFSMKVLNILHEIFLTF